MRQNVMVGFAVACVLMLTAACSSDMSGSSQGMKSDSGMKQSMGPSLYERLGKKDAITAVVDDFVGRVANDTRINGKFANANIPPSTSGLKVGDKEADLTVGINWYLNDYTRIMFNYLHVVPVDPNFGASYADEFVIRTAIFW